jgi:hopanoid biosynthesis associated radical SAM protein HpnH
MPPLSQAWTVATYVLAQRLRGVERYPLVLMLEPLFRCNLACGGCGKIQFPAEILRRHLTPEQCFAAADECGAPVISIPGGEPLLHPQIHEIVAGLVARRKFLYLCTNALKLEEALPRFAPSKYLAFSVHMDGPRAEHDLAVCREGTYDIAVRAIRAARARGFRVTTNTTLFAGADPARVRTFFDEMMALGVEGMMVSPGYSYEKAPDQDHFLRRDQTTSLFRAVLARPWSARPASGQSRLAERDDHKGRARRTWKFNQTPLFLEFLQGRFDLECTPWGSPTYNLFGWQRPCYLLGEGYCQSFRELMETTDWESYGRKSGNAKCRDCMVHCGHEPTAVDTTFASWRGFRDSVVATVTGRL